MRSNCMSKALCFLQITAKLQDYPFFTVFLIIKTSTQNISITLLKISLKSHEHRGCYWRKKLPWTILEKQFPVPRNTAARKIGNVIIPLLWQLRCHWNPYHNKFSSLCSPPAINQQSMHQEYITNVQERRKRPIGAFLMLFLCRKKPYGEGSKTVFREVKSHFFPDKITWGILRHPDTPNI